MSKSISQMTKAELVEFASALLVATDTAVAEQEPVISLADITKACKLGTISKIEYEKNGKVNSYQYLVKLDSLSNLQEQALRAFGFDSKYTSWAGFLVRWASISPKRNKNATTHTVMDILLRNAGFSIK